MSTTVPRSRTHLSVIGLCLAANIFDGYDLIVYGSVVPALLAHEEWSLTPQQIGSIGSYTLIGMFIGSLLCGFLTDRFGRRRTFIACLIWFSCAMLLTAAAPNPEMLGLFRFLAGLGFGGVSPTAIALVVEHAPRNRRNVSNALMLSGFPLGGVLAAVLALNLLEDHGFRVMFALGGLPLLTVVPLAIWLLPESPTHRPARTSRADGLGPASLLRGRTAIAVLLFAAANFCGMLIVFGLNTWLPQLMRNAGHGLDSALTFLLLLNAGAVIGGIGGSTIADRLGGRWVCAIGFLLAACGILALGIGLPTAALYVLVMLAGAGVVGTQMVLFGYVATSFPVETRATAIGFANGVGRLGGAVGPSLIGYLLAAKIGTGWNFAVFAAVAVGASLFCTVVPSPRSRTREHAAEDAAVASA
jgi:AAHS family benzoate transporter-like MFS transporter